MAPIDEKRFQENTRLILRLVIENMIDISALKVVLASEVPSGLEKLKMADEVTRQKYQPFLDSLETATDQMLLDQLRSWKGPVQ